MATGHTWTWQIHLVFWMQLLCKAQADVQQSHQLIVKGALDAWQVKTQILLKESALFWRTSRSSVKSVFMFSFSPTMSFIVIPKFCRINNGDCEQFCSVRRDGQKDVVCSCADGYALAEDGKSCVATGMEPCDEPIAVVVRLGSQLRDVLVYS